jgi:hypothetical protein
VGPTSQTPIPTPGPIGRGFSATPSMVDGWPSHPRVAWLAQVSTLPISHSFAIDLTIFCASLTSPFFHSSVRSHTYSPFLLHHRPHLCLLQRTIDLAPSASPVVPPLPPLPLGRQTQPLLCRLLPCPHSARCSDI